MNAEEETKEEIKNIFKHDHGTVSKVQGKPIAIVTATSTYIPIDEFQSLFHKVGELVDAEKIEKLIFDKRELTVFHQPSMEWYFTEWKEEMWQKGLKKHRKILPDNKVFQQSVKIGRDKINNQYPNHKFHEMDIQYKKDLQSAIDE